MAVKGRKLNAHGRNQDRARLAGQQDRDVRDKAKKTGQTASVAKTAKKVGNIRERVEDWLGHKL